MSDLESLFRWAIYYDYRTTPERILRNLRNRLYGGVNDLHDTSVINVYSRLTDCSAEQISRSHLVLSISEFLGRYKQNIMQEARSRGIDARAVAAAMDALARQPEAASTISRTLFVGLAMIETTAIYCLVISLLLLFANPFLR